VQSRHRCDEFDADRRGSCITYISIFTTPAKRPLYTALISAYVSPSTSDDGEALKTDARDRFWGLGAVIGPVVGGAFAQSNATWRW